MRSRSWLPYGAAWLLALLFADGMILAVDALPLKAAGIALLSAFLPGMALVYAVFPLSSELDGWERAALGFALGLFGSLQVVWGTMLFPGRLQAPVLLLLLNAFALLLALLALWRLSRAGGSAPVISSWRGGKQSLIGLALLAMAACLLFFNLDYIEYDHDETAVIANALTSIQGNEDAVFALRKGPTQILVATTSILLGGTALEGFVRLPFALVGLMTTIMLWRLGRRLLGGTAALVALALWLGEGTHLGENRWVQYQGIIYLSGLCAVFCLWRAERTTGSLRRRFQLAGAFCFASGLFTHYDGFFIGLALGLLWLWMERASLHSVRGWLPAAVAAGCIALVAGPFYVALSQESAGSRIDRYVSLRVGIGPFNMMAGFFRRMAVFDAPVWILAVGVGLVLAGIWAGRHYWRRSRALGVLWFGLLLLAALAAIDPDAFDLAGANWSFVPYMCLLLLLLLLPNAGLPARLLGVWALGTWMFPAFGMQIPGDHYYPALPALSLLAAMSIVPLYRLGARRLAPPVLHPLLGAAALLVILTGAIYTYVMLVSTKPEYAMLYPDTVAAPLALFVSERPPLLYGSYPHQSGWRAIAALYDQGVLRGEYESNEFPAISDWYLSINWRPNVSNPRYYLQVVRPFAPILGSDVPADLLQTHRLVGKITVAGEPHMLIYQKNDGSAPSDVKTWPVESLSSEWQRLASLSRFSTYHSAGRDDSAFYAAARQIAVEEQPGDAVLIDGPLARGLLAQFYTGELPLLTTLAAPGAAQARRIWGVYWASPDRAIERAVAEQDCPANTRWFQNVRLTLNGRSGYGAPTNIDAELGRAARLVSVALGDNTRNASIFCVRLAWSILEPTDKPYKLFVHIVNSGGKVVAQADTEPLAGLKPSNTWVAGEQFADQVGVMIPSDLRPDTYRLLAGLYSEKDGVRLPALHADGKRYVNDAVLLGAIPLP